MRIDELRAGLHEQADQVRDQGIPARLQGVQHRVRVVRRRRTTVVAAAAIAAVAGAAVTLLPQRSVPEPADAPRILAGHTVPTTQDAYGYTYRYVEGVEGDPGENPLKLRVTVGDEPRLIGYASSEPGSVLTVGTGDAPQMGAPSGAFTDNTLYLPPSGDPDGETTVTVRLEQAAGLGDGTLALAVYDLAAAPDGVTNGETTFRRETAGQTLVDAHFGEPGETELEFTVILPEGRLQWVPLCYGGAEGTVARVEVDGSGYVGSGCAGGVAEPDAGRGGFSFVDDDPAPRGEPVRVRMWLGSDEGDAQQVVADDDVVLGLGVYVESGPRHEVLGQSLPVLTEDAGHTWAYDRHVVGKVGADRLVVTVPASDEPLLVSGVMSGLDPAGYRLRFDVGGQSQGEEAFIEAFEATVSGMVLAPSPTDQRVVLALEKGATARTQLAVVLSSLAD